MTPAPLGRPVGELITAVLPTHYRASYLRRAARYYRDVPFPVVVADSSSERFDDLLPARFEYHHVPDMMYGRKIAFAFEQVKTPYCLLINDDDFFRMEAISRELAFLEANRDYSSAQGFYLWLYQNDERRVLYQAYDKRLGFRIDAPNPPERLLQLRAGYMHLSYATCRTAAVREIMHHVRHFPNPFAVEYLVANGLLMFGKHQMLPILHCVRDQQLVSTGKDPMGFGGMEPIPLRAREYHAAYYALICLAREGAGYSYQDAFDMVDRLAAKPMVTRTVQERTPPPFGPLPAGVDDLTPAQWLELVSLKANPPLRALQDKVLAFVDACATRVEPPVSFFHDVP